MVFDSQLARRLPLRILITEDTAINQKLVTLVLAKFGYTADVAANGLEAVAALERQPYDVILRTSRCLRWMGWRRRRRFAGGGRVALAS